MGGKKNPPSQQRFCFVVGCGLPIVSRGLCRNHTNFEDQHEAEVRLYELERDINPPPLTRAAYRKKLRSITRDLRWVGVNKTKTAFHTAMNDRYDLWLKENK